MVEALEGGSCVSMVHPKMRDEYPIHAKSGPIECMKERHMSQEQETMSKSIEEEMREKVQER